MRAIAPRTLALLMVVSLFAVRPAHATEPFAKVQRWGANWLQYPIGIRNVGMGATGTADVTGFATGYFNPASVAWTSATTVTSSYEDFDAASLGISLFEAQVTTPFPLHSDSTNGAWSFSGGLAYTRQGMADQQERTIFLPEGTGHTFDPDDWMISALASSRWDHGVVSLGAGVTAKFVDQALAGAGGNLWAMDIGLIAAFPIPVGDGLIRPRLGYAALNLDNGGSYDDEDFKVANEERGGFGLDLVAPRVGIFGRQVPSVALAVDYDRIDREHGAYQSTPEFATGFELSLVNLVHVRYGELDDDYTMYGAGLGWDYGNVLFRLDYAHTHPEDSFYRDYFNLERDAFGATVGMRW